MIGRSVELSLAWLFRCLLLRPCALVLNDDGGGAVSSAMMSLFVLEDSAIRTNTRQRATTEGSFSLQLHLYLKTSLTIPGFSGPVVAYEAMFLTPDCTTSYQLFNRVCKQISADYSYST